MQFSIITPSYRQSDWLKLCIASVADQGIECEHIVQDAGSDDGTLDWLSRDARVRTFVEKDAGMYDAVNRGLRRSSGEILAYLNCDEQYLPGVLQRIRDFFSNQSDIDVLFGDVVTVDQKGDYLWHRKVQRPLLYHTWTCHLSTLTCAMFFRRRIVFEMNELFDPAWRDAGDAEWMVRLIRRRLKMATLGEFTSAFTQTGVNMSARPNALRENIALGKKAPQWVRAMRPLIVCHHRLRRFLGGMYRQAPFSYEVYTRENLSRRTVFQVPRPTVFRR